MIQQDGQYSRRQFLGLIAAIGSTAIGAEHYVQSGETLSSIGLEIPEKEKEKNNEVISPPVNKELEEKIDYLRKEKIIAKWEVPATRGILYTQADDLDKILAHYKQGSRTFHDIMSQESGYKIDSIGPAGERGTAQFLKGTANSIAKKVSDRNDSLYYLGFNLKDYRFENLSIDYRLNNILKAAYLKNINNEMEKDNVNRDELFKKLKSRALTLNYEKFGKTGKKLKQTLIDLWNNEAENYKDTLVFYLYYNANGRINDGTLYRMGLLMKNAKDYRPIREKVFKALKKRPSTHQN